MEWCIQEPGPQKERLAFALPEQIVLESSFDIHCKGPKESSLHLRWQPKQRCFFLIRADQGIVIEQAISVRFVETFRSQEDSSVRVRCELMTTPISYVDLVFEPAYLAYSLRSQSASSAQTVVKSPITGTVLSSHVENGSEVKTGDLLLVIEAMKMENKITASKDGKVQQLQLKAGDKVVASQTLMKIAPSH